MIFVFKSFKTNNCKIRRQHCIKFLGNLYKMRVCNHSTLHIPIVSVIFNIIVQKEKEPKQVLKLLKMIVSFHLSLLEKNVSFIHYTKRKKKLEMKIKDIDICLPIVLIPNNYHQSIVLSCRTNR